MPPSIPLQTHCHHCGRKLDISLAGGSCPSCLWGGLLVIESEPQDGDDLPEVEGYKIRREIGRGGMGVVYLAEQESPVREVALKIVAPYSLRAASQRLRFLLEIEAMAAVTHPALLPLYESGEDDDGRPWFTMQLAGGGTLAERLGRYQGKWSMAAALMVRLAEAVQFSHERGILHRDLKPANVLFDVQDHAYVADFGLAKWAETEGALTQTTEMLGSPAYLAPEAVAGGTRATTTASDVYGLGTIFHELLTGRKPYEGESAAVVMSQILHRDPVAPRHLVPGIPRDLEVITLKAMARDPTRRYSSAGAMAEDLTRWLESRPILARPAGAFERICIWARRNPALAALVSVSVLGVAAFLIQMRISNRLLATESETSRTQARLARAAEVQALENSRTARKSAYLADMSAAAQARLSGNYSAARRLLASQVPHADAEDQRGIEWAILMELCAGDKPAYSFQLTAQVKALSAPPGSTHFWALDGQGVRSWRMASMEEEPAFSPKPDSLDVAKAFAAAALTMQSWRAAETLARSSPYECNTLETFMQDSALEPGMLNFSRDVLGALDGAWLAIATEQKGVSIWENAHHSLVRVLPGSWANLALSNDGSRMALTCAAEPGGPYGTFIYDTQSWQPVCYLGNTGEKVALSPDGSLLADPEGLRETATGRMVSRFSEGASRCFSFSPDGAHVATNAWNGSVVIYEVLTGKVRMFLAGPATALAFDAKSSLLAVGGMDHVLRVWGWEQAYFHRVYHGQEAAITSVTWTGDNHLFAGGADGNLNVWSFGPDTTPEPKIKFTSALQDLPGTALMGGLRDDGHYCLCDMASGDLKHEFPLPGNLKSWHTTGDGRAIVLAVNPPDAPARVLRLALPSGKVERETVLEGPIPEGHVHLNADGTRLAVLANDLREAWDGVSGALLYRNPNAIGLPSYSKFSPDGSTVLELGGLGSFSAWSFPDWKPLWQKDIVQSRWFVNNDATLAAAANKDGSITLHSMSDGALVGTLTAHTGQVYDIDINWNSTRLVSTDDRETRLWDIGTLREAANLGHLGLVQNIRFSSDGKRLLIRLPVGAHALPRLLPSGSNCNYATSAQAAVLGFNSASNPIAMTRGAVSFGYSTTLGGTFVLDTFSGTNASGVQEWTPAGPLGNNPGVRYNPTTSPIVISATTFDPQKLSLHPGASGEYAIVRYSASFLGESEVCSFTGSFWGQDAVGTTTEVHILKNGGSIFDGNVAGCGPGSARPFALSLTVNPGDNFDFTVGRGSNGTFFNDSTGLEVDITHVP